jgi:hypothetical protein
MASMLGMPDMAIMLCMSSMGKTNYKKVPRWEENAAPAMLTRSLEILGSPIQLL